MITAELGTTAGVSRLIDFDHFYMTCTCLCDVVELGTRIYLPVTFKCTQEFVCVMFHSYSALTNRQNTTVIHV